MRQLWQGASPGAAVSQVFWNALWPVSCTEAVYEPAPSSIPRIRIPRRQAEAKVPEDAHEYYIRQPDKAASVLVSIPRLIYRPDKAASLSTTPPTAPWRTHPTVLAIPLASSVNGRNSCGSGRVHDFMRSNSMHNDQTASFVYIIFHHSRDDDGGLHRLSRQPLA
ncbi:hypothetical protein HaLaN_25384 [Haematococcus lacustris]|uniref:Uncharacterized protein n=1 Tax=Haematococcus lacustris TaxID=44745 RepID=A0A699ZW19_HAELA|nr:hypothetical protein HaLaN_25384 [Haematococcus lacustris]